ncbi:EthD family reductase [Nocardioides marmotae]|uniref:EthD family reductase n=1 Tax=Nocardioides marmotae TaxID=2663857 RepID=UPI0012B589E6|nr:EthD family reductase [Nocardioides marmotae]MBC9734319.1 EthD family reductase [Nocardioides marmotae]MTB85420.1 EthD family reductase [Nocardioides marmotae]
MYKLIACWSAPRPEDEDAFEQHYRDVHLPAAAAVPNLRRLVATRTASGLEGGEASFYRVAEMVFDSQADLEASEHSEEWGAMRADAGVMIERFGVSLQVGLGEETQAEPGPR